ncbi:hypothetical protein FDE76_15020 [Clostridium botulinum]|nr:hypothetical protein [Clostridium botulinum]NFJ40686.1 hypothetical protein [Clostridium botulinum B str. Eklund 17B (NRP)]MBY6975825.1 hypothetical protein [Clostridium botulinum]MBY7000248.1 hypothetical protein [Clostridium botulinum]NFD71523.1 hypothetical protein [Clostridium botulinum]
MIGNSLISVPELDIAKDMDNIDVHINEILTLKLEYDKNISKIYEIEVEGLGEGRKTTPIEIVNNSVKAPEEKGEYVYSVKVIWNSTPESAHFASYVIKLNVI